MYKNCDIYIMELVEGIVWVLTGFVSTLIALEVGWRLANKKRIKHTQEVKCRNGRCRNNICVIWFVGTARSVLPTYKFGSEIELNRIGPKSSLFFDPFKPVLYVAIVRGYHDIQVQN